MRKRKKVSPKKVRFRPRLLWLGLALTAIFWVQAQYDRIQNVPVEKPAVRKDPRKGHAPKPAAVAKGDVLKGKAVHIPDGDTFDLLTAGQKKIRIRMSGMDAPEKAQDFGQVAKEGLGSLLQGKQLRVVVRDLDRYGRAVCDVYAAAALGEDWINLQMVQKGWAWHYKQYSKDAQLAAAEQAARAAHKGLWSQSNPTAPWVFRADKRRS